MGGAEKGAEAVEAVGAVAVGVEAQLPQAFAPRLDPFPVGGEAPEGVKALGRKGPGTVALLAGGHRGGIEHALQTLAQGDGGEEVGRIKVGAIELGFVKEKSRKCLGRKAFRVNSVQWPGQSVRRGEIALVGKSPGGTARGRHRISRRPGASGR